MTFLAPAMNGSPSSVVPARLARAVSTADHDHLTQPGVSLVAGGITPRRTNSSTVLCEMLSSHANSARLIKDGGRLAGARLTAAPVFSQHYSAPLARPCRHRSRI